MTLPFALVAGDAPGVFKLPGTESTMKIYGFAELNATFDQGTRNSDIDDWDWATFLPTQPFDKTSLTPSNSPTNQTYLTARTSRLGVTTSTPSSVGNVTMVLEADFNSPSPSNFSSPTTTNGNTFRLRKAYGQVGDFLFGQTWSTFFDGDSVPDSVDFNPVASADATRQGMLQYTFHTSKQSTLALALEAPFDRQYVGMAGHIATQNGSNSPADYAADAFATVPDLIANYTFSDSWGHVSVRGVELQYKDANHSANGFGGAVSGHFNIAKDSLVWSVAGGNGIGRYMLASVTQSAVEDGSKVNLWKAVGMHVGYTHVWNAAWRSNIIASRVQFTDPGTGLASGMSLNEYVQQGLGGYQDLQPNKTLDNYIINTFYNISKTTYFGLEYNYGKRTTFDTFTANKAGALAVDSAANTGTQKRINFQFHVNFF